MEMSLITFSIAALIFIATISYCVFEIRAMSSSEESEGSTGIAQTSSNTVDGEQ